MSRKSPRILIDEAATFIDVLRGRALDSPDRMLYTFLGDGGVEEAFLTYQALDRRARSLAATLQSLAPQGSRALLLCPPGPEFIVGFLGCLYAGVTAVPSVPPFSNRAMPRLRSIAADAGAVVALATSNVLDRLRRLGDGLRDFPSLHWLAVEQCDEAQAGDWCAPEVNGDDVAFLQYTSGSTATPKGVMVTHRSLMANLEAIRCAFRATPQCLTVSWLPPHHDMGLIGGLLETLYLGAETVIMTPAAFVQNPIGWLRAVSRYGARVSGGPNFAYDLCARKATAEQIKTLDLSRWEVAFTGAEPIRRRTLERFAEVFEPCGFRREAFYPCYGLAESTLFVSGGERCEAPAARHFDKLALERRRVVEHDGNDGQPQSLVACGRPPAGHDLVIADPNTGAPCAADQVGEVWVRGPSVGAGYWNRPDETQETFHASLANDEGPFLRTGDLGFLHRGELFIAGRLKDLIILRGRNLYPQDIEATVEQAHASLRSACAAAFSLDVEGEERLVVVQEAERRLGEFEAAQVVAAIRKAVAQEHEAHVYAVTLIRSASLPRTTSGKVQRHACRNGYLSGSLAVVHSSVCEEAPEESKTSIQPALDRDESAVCADLRGRVAELVGADLEMIDPEQSLNSQGIDSLMAMDMQIYLKRRYNFALESHEIAEDITLMDIVRQIAAAASGAKCLAAAVGDRREPDDCRELSPT